MVRWYSPSQLLDTGSRVAASFLFARYDDARLTEALFDRGGAPFLDFRDPQSGLTGSGAGDFWIDFVADAGDGWDPAYAVASAVAQPKLRVSGPAASGAAGAGMGAPVVPVDLPGASLLVFGGDQVYPTPSRQAYRERLEEVYRAAFCGAASTPTVVAIPGNHDWYDNLASFARLFCTQRSFGGCPTRQRRSYFAARLPHGWWLLGADYQLGADLDGPQVDYFKEVAALMGPGDRVILCTPEPSWTLNTVYQSDGGASDHNRRFLTRLLGHRVVLHLAGDLHHYRRHAHPHTGVQMITAGGGGAFLHPTHGPDVRKLSDGSLEQASFPSSRTTWRLTFLNLAFPWFNPTFGLITASIYTLFVWIMLEATAAGNPRDPLDLLWRLPFSAGGSLLAIALLAGVVLFTDTHSRLHRVIGGLLHGAAHLAAASTLAWLAHLASSSDVLPVAAHRLLMLAGVFAGGWIVGAVLLGLYLLVSLNVFSRHADHAFSSLRLKGWKSFVRLKLASDGSLSIYPIGLRRVPRTRGEAFRAEPEILSGDRGLISLFPDRLKPELIEAPVRITPDRRDHAGHLKADARVAASSPPVHEPPARPWYMGLNGRIG